MKRKLSERAAWLKLASYWDKPIQDPWSKDYYIEIADEGKAWGLCASVEDLCAAKMITHDTLKTMTDKIDADARACRVGYTYYWQLTKRGAKSRAAFCRKMAEQCKKTKSKGRKNVNA